MKIRSKRNKLGLQTTFESDTKRIWVARWFLIACFLTPPCSFASTEGISESETTKINRLIGLCTLWGHVKYFHPSLAYRADIDWDAALVETIPKVRNAKSRIDYAAALQGLLDNLGDPVTRVVDASASPETKVPNANQKLDYKMTSDVLLITVGDYFGLWNSESQQKLRAIIAELPKAKAVVFDLRSAQPAGDYGKFQLTSSFSQIERMISSVPFLTPGERSRIHRGFVSSSTFSSGQYKSGFYIQDVKRIIPTQNAKDIPSVFLLNKNAGVLDSTTSLQAAGKGLVVFEGAVKDSAVGKTANIDLGERLSAQVRVTEPILEDGTNGDLMPDLVVPMANGESDTALKSALELAINFKPSNIVRKKLPAAAAPFPDKSYSQMKYPSLEFRLLAAFRMWNAIEHFFPYKNLMDRDWTQVLREYIPKFENFKNALDYSLTVAEMMTHVHDSHAYVSGTELNDHFGTGYPPIRVRVIENALVVTHFYNEEIARASGIEIGDIVLKVDGEDAKIRLARYAKYISASTPQSNTDKASLTFMNGEDKSIVTLTVRGRNNREKEGKLPRKYEDSTTLYNRERSGDIFKLLPGNIGYADLDRLTGTMVDEMLERFKNTKGIIFDMRGYPNGVFWLLPQRLTDKRDVPAALLETPIVGQISSVRSSDIFSQNLFPAQPDKWTYKGKTLMLIDERSMSQAEHTGLFLRAANKTEFVGSPTAGANGELTTFSVPGGIGIGFSGQSVRFPDGKQLQRIGLLPDVKIKPTIKGIRDRRDEVLEEAIRYLNSKLGNR